MNINYENLGIEVKTKRRRRFLDAGLLNNIDKKFVKEVHEYWQK